jgi:hypothetical protein
VGRKSERAIEVTLQDGDLQEGRIEVAFGNDSHNGIAVPYHC